MHVLIAGAGLGGLMLASLLEKAQISYLVLEKAQEIKPLGSAISLGPNILSVFKQLGIYSEFVTHALPLLRGLSKYHPARKEMIEDYTFMKERYGDYLYIIDRPRLYEIMRKLVPEDKILLGKKVANIQQNDHGVMVRCKDGTGYHGHLLVGADGAYSTVRQTLYKELKSKGQLPEDDDTDPPFNTYCLVGVSRPVPVGTFEYIEGESRYESLLIKNPPYMTTCFSQRDGGVGWLVFQSAGRFRTREEVRSQSSDWGPEGALDMVSKVRDLPSPFGPPMSVFIDNTPKNGISKVMLEEKLYQTWTYGRTALMGDACHKFFPYGGQGAINAMLDAVVLANVLEACPTTSIGDVRQCLDTYQKERFHSVKQSYKSVEMAGELVKWSFKADIMRLIYSIMPRSLVHAQWDTALAFRPQAAFLPFVSPEGTIRPGPQNKYEHLRVAVTI